MLAVATQNGYILCFMTSQPSLLQDDGTALIWSSEADAKPLDKITAEFKEHSDDPFSTAQWRGAIARNGNRVGLALCGNLSAAVTVLAPDAGHGASLRQAVRGSEELRDLIAFACTKTYAAAREQLGFGVEALPESDPPS